VPIVENEEKNGEKIEIVARHCGGGDFITYNWKVLTFIPEAVESFNSLFHF